MSYNEIDLEALLERVSQRDEAAFRALHERTRVHLLSVAQAILRGRELAEDVLQEIYLTVWSRAHQYDPAVAKPMTWLISMTRHRAIDLLRSRRSHLSETLDVETLANDDASEHLLPSVDSADLLAERSGNEIRIQSGMRRLSATQRQSLALAYFHGLSHSEVADRLGAPLGSVKGWIRRGLQHMRHGMEATA